MKQYFTNLSCSRPDSFSSFILKRVDVAFRIERKDHWLNRHTDLQSCGVLVHGRQTTRSSGHAFTAQP